MARGRERRALMCRNRTNDRFDFIIRGCDQPLEFTDAPGRYIDALIEQRFHNLWGRARIGLRQELQPRLDGRLHDARTDGLDYGPEAKANAFSGPLHHTGFRHRASSFANRRWRSPAARTVHKFPVRLSGHATERRATERAHWPASRTSHAPNGSADGREPFGHLVDPVGLRHGLTAI